MIGFVYVIRCGDFVKIGWSRNPRSRLSIARSFNVNPVEMLAYFSASEKEEKKLHERFIDHQVGSGEWFRFEGNVFEWVGSLATDDDDVLVKWLRENRGSAVRLSEIIGVTPGAISQWRRTPTQHIIPVERFTGISRVALRPDIYEGFSPEDFETSKSVVPASPKRTRKAEAAS